MAGSKLNQQFIENFDPMIIHSNIICWVQSIEDRKARSSVEATSFGEAQ